MSEEHQEAKLLALDAWLEKVKDEEFREELRKVITALEPIYGRPKNLYQSGSCRYELPILGKTIIIRVSVGV